MDRAELERLDREGLVLRAQAAGIKRARVLTRPELVDELVRLDPHIDASHLKRSRGFFGLARDLLSRVVERGLHLPDAAERFRAALADPLPHVPRPEAQAIPTVTLAEIYAAQGHKQRAIETLKRVLEAEPDNGAARALLEKLQAADYVAPPPKLPPEPEVEVAPADDEEDDELPNVSGFAPEPPTLSRRAEDEAGVAAPVPAPEKSDLTPESATISEALPATMTAPPVRPDASPDRCVAVPIAGDISFVTWRLSPASLRLAEESFFFVRVVAIVPSWDGPEVRVRDVAADPGAGELVVRDLPSGAVVRVAIGFMPDGELVPVAHSPALELGPSRSLVQWRLDDADPIVLDHAAVRAAIERANHLRHV